MAVAWPNGQSGHGKTAIIQLNLSLCPEKQNRADLRAQIIQSFQCYTGFPLQACYPSAEHYHHVLDIVIFGSLKWCSTKEH
jgi:hypothetical protein